MNRKVFAWVSLACLVSVPVALAQTAEDATPPEMLGGFAADTVLNDMQAWSFRQARKVISDLANERMTSIRLGVLRGESRAARFSVTSGNGLAAIAGGLTYECKEDAGDEDGFFRPRTDEELEDACNWVIWQYSLDEAESHLREAVFSALDKAAVAALIEAKGYPSDEAFPKGRTDWRDVVDVYTSVKKEAVRTDEYTTETCPSLDLALSWFEGFKPTPVDIERYGEDARHPLPQLTDQLFEAMIYSRIKGGFLELRYSGYSGEPQDVAGFLTATIAQCNLEAEN